MDALTALYQDLHRNPELSFAEERTARIAADHLRATGYEVFEQVGRTGVVGILRNGEGPVVLLRADMDALPVREDTGLPYSSTATARDANGVEVAVMHACGHDVHVACLIRAATELSEMRSEWTGTLVALFQPAEELGIGAQAMIDDGLYSKVPLPDVVLGQHVGPAPAGAVGAHPGPAFASNNSVNITVYGRGGHGSRPETTIDPIVLGATIVTRLQTIIAREIAPQETAVVTVGRFLAGTKNNIIPGQATLGLNIRAYSERTRAQILDAVTRIVLGEAAASGAPEPLIEHTESLPATVNDPGATARINAEFESRFGRDALLAPGAVSGSEDVGLLATEAGAPLAYWILGGTDAELFAEAARNDSLERDIPSNHSPHFAPVLDPTLRRGVDALVTAAQSYLQRH